MNYTILKEFGWCQVLKHDHHFWLRYDEGSIAVEYKMIEVSFTEAENAIANENIAEEIIKSYLKGEGDLQRFGKQR